MLSSVTRWPSTPFLSCPDMVSRSASPLSLCSDPALSTGAAASPSPLATPAAWSFRWPKNTPHFRSRDLSTARIHTVVGRTPILCLILSGIEVLGPDGAPRGDNPADGAPTATGAVTKGGGPCVRGAARAAAVKGTQRWKGARRRREMEWSNDGSQAVWVIPRGFSCFNNSHNLNLLVDLKQTASLGPEKYLAWIFWYNCNNCAHEFETRWSLVHCLTCGAFYMQN